MKKYALPVSLFLLLLAMFWTAPAFAAAPSLNTETAQVNAALPPGTFPFFYIEAVSADQTVTIKAFNFPANDSFNVLMGAYGTASIGGTKVATQTTGAGGPFTATYNIPAGLKGSYRIAIRLESPTSKYFAYNWFYNQTGAAPQPTPTAQPTASPTPVVTPTPTQKVTYPTFSIKGVVRNEEVTIEGKNFPANDKFTVTMGLMGTKGINGTVVETYSSGQGGSFTATFKIPAGLKDKYQIAIRLQSPTSGYFAYNWFYNNTSTAQPPAATQPAPPPVVQDTPGKPPVFFITSVVRNNTVTISASNFPHNDDFKVTMGKMGTKGFGGYEVAMQSSGNGTFTATYNIPAALANSYQISIRLQSAKTGYYSFNWFYNNNAP